MKRIATLATIMLAAYSIAFAAIGTTAHTPCIIKPNHISQPRDNIAGDGAADAPDFNYVQTVSETALSDLATALKNGDGCKTVDALVRYGLAQSMISRDNASAILNKVDSIASCERHADYRTLLRLIEMKMYSDYSNSSWQASVRKNAEGERPDDISEWSETQFQNKIKELAEACFADSTALKSCPVTSYAGILRHNDAGAQLIPTLYDFLLHKAWQTAEAADDGYAKDIAQRWLSFRNSPSPANIYARLTTGESGEAIYADYRDSEWGGMALKDLDSREHYSDMKEYLSMFPDGIYAPDISNCVREAEAEHVRLSSPGTVHSGDSITAVMQVTNAHDITVSLYRIKDSAFLNSQRTYRAYTDKDLTLVCKKQVHVGGKVPFDAHDVRVSFAPQSYGAYMVRPSLGEASGHRTNSSVIVTDLRPFSISYSNGESHLFVVDSRTGAPVRGVTVSGKNSVEDKKETDADGCVRFAKANKSSRLIKGQDQYNSTYISTSQRTAKDQGKVNVFTDLGIYRPGETVKFVAIAYTEKVDSREVLPDIKLTFELIDADHNTVDTISLVTDSYGRATGTFTLPTDRMNGSWQIYAHCKQNIKVSERKHIEVSEYKAPTFSIDFPDVKAWFAKSQPVTISGTAITYSGMPLADAEVKVRLTKSQGFWWWRSGNATGEHVCDTVVRTDPQGNFTLTLQASNFEENDDKTKHSRWNRYAVTASVTDDAGETQEGSISFTIGNQRGFKFTSTDFDADKSKPVKLPVAFASNDSTEKNVTSAYTLTTLQGRHAHSGTFSSSNPIVDLSKVASGRYNIEVHVPGDPASGDTTTITIYAPTDKTAPVSNSAMWIPSSGYKVDDQNIAHVVIGTSVAVSHIYYVARSRSEEVAKGWLTYKPGMHDLKISMPDVPDSQVKITLVSTYNDTTNSCEITLVSRVKAQQLQIKLTSFRNKLLPGDREHWSLRLVDAKGQPVQGAMVLEMFDKALNTLADNQWTFSPSYAYKSICTANVTHRGTYYDYCNSSCKRAKINTITLPSLYTYDQSFFQQHRPYVVYAKAQMASTMELAAGAAEEESASILEERQVGSSMSSATDNAADMGAAQSSESEFANITLRQTDVKTALWLPQLTSDGQGNVTLEFDAPNFNTTWIMQAISYTAGVVAGQMRQEIVTQKPLMVKSSLPRFVRNGDVATLSASVQNATDSAVTARAMIEIFNPNTGAIYTARQFQLNLSAKGSEAVSIEWQVPDTASLAGFRIKSTANGHSDGEQALLTVLPATQPVIETHPFYIDAAQPDFSLAMPQSQPDSRVTLEYCDNPVWYCALALPTIYNSNHNIATSLAHDLYAQELAQLITRQNPQIAEAVAYWKEHPQDSALVSMLAKNSDLKIGSLKASPFASNAECDTRRMQSLEWLFDSAKMAQEHKRIVAGLQMLQNADGGFMWYKYPSCRSSLWVTSEVLEMIGELKHLGCLEEDDDINDMSSRAIKYFDQEYLRFFKEQTKLRKHDYTGFAPYAYIRTLFPSEPLPAENCSMLNKVLSSMDSEWKGLSLGEKAYFAMALWRNSHKKTARAIVESIRQFAITKPETGTYWDALQEGWLAPDKVAVTASILQALNEIDPQQQELDNVRKWMLLMKQSNDWGSSSLAADAVYSLLATGSQWLQRNATPSVTIGTELLHVDKLDSYLGYFRTTLSGGKGDLHISRSGQSPAWGAVYVQTVAPMSSVTEHSITELSINKEYYVYANDGTLHRADTFRVGDKVQVHVVIKCNKDIDYVTVADERAACFEPVDQTSGYRSMDHIWFYHETKDSETNLFFDSLPKGTHVIGYDVHVTSSGSFASGVATVQSQYAPQLTAHTAGTQLAVE